MAHPVAAGQQATGITTATTTPVLTLPGSIASGDLLFAVYRAAGAGAISWPAGWTELIENTSDGSDDVTAMAYRWADGTEGSTITLGSGSVKGAGIVYRITGAMNPATQPPELSAVAANSTNTPDPSTVTPTGGSKDYLFLWVAAYEGEQGTPGSPPTNYTSVLTASSGTAGAVATNCRVTTAYRQLTAASENPGSIALSAADDWTAWTVAIHPATVSPDVTVNVPLQSVASSKLSVTPQVGSLLTVGLQSVSSSVLAVVAGAGSIITVPLQQVASSKLTVSVLTGSVITVPLQSIASSIFPVTVAGAGVEVIVPLLSISGSILPVVVQHGHVISVSLQQIASSKLTVTPQVGSTVTIPLKTVATSILPVAAQTGATVAVTLQVITGSVIPVASRTGSTIPVSIQSMNVSALPVVVTATAGGAISIIIPLLSVNSSMLHLEPMTTLQVRKIHGQTHIEYGPRRLK